MEGAHSYKKYYFVNIAKMFTDETYPKLAKVDQTFKDKMTLKLKDGKTIEIEELGTKGISSNQTVAYVPETRSLFVGDLIHHKAHAWLEGGIVGGKPVPDLISWKKSLLELAKSRPSDVTVFGGRGESASLKSAVETQVAYLEKADKIVTDYVQSLGVKKSELLTSASAKHFQILEEKFIKEFPGYTLSYLINYGVYGLANSK